MNWLLERHGRAVEAALGEQILELLGDELPNSGNMGNDYEVSDWPTLAQAMDTCVDVHGNPEEGWERLIDCDDGHTRSRATINPANHEQQLSVRYRTQRQADEGRTWFDAAAGDAVKFRRRESRIRGR